YALVRLRGQSRSAVVATIVFAGILFAVAWGPMALRQSSSFSEAVGEGAYGDPDSNRIALTLHRAVAAPMRAVLDLGVSPTGIILPGALLLVLPWLMLRKNPRLLLWALWPMAVIAFVAMVDLAQATRFLQQPRQISLAGPAICAMLAAVASQWRPALRH